MDVKTDECTLFFNPSCSNCQTALALLEERDVPVRVVEYLSDAPTRAQLEDVLAKLGTQDPSVIIRTKEPVYDELELSTASRDELLDSMVSNPILIQRPIVIRGERAVVARPPERLLELLD